MFFFHYFKFNRLLIIWNAVFAGLLFIIFLLMGDGITYVALVLSKKRRSWIMNNDVL